MLSPFHHFIHDLSIVNERRDFVCNLRLTECWAAFYDAVFYGNFMYKCKSLVVRWAVSTAFVDYKHTYNFIIICTNCSFVFSTQNHLKLYFYIVFDLSEKVYDLFITASDFCFFGNLFYLRGNSAGVFSYSRKWLFPPFRRPFLGMSSSSCTFCNCWKKVTS